MCKNKKQCSCDCKNENERFDASNNTVSVIEKPKRKKKEPIDKIFIDRTRIMNNPPPSFVSKLNLKKF